MNWLNSNKKKIFCFGDVEINEKGVEWIYDKGSSSVKINWEEIDDVYVSAETGANNIYIDSADGRTINFYVNNSGNGREKFLKHLREFAIIKGAKLISQ